MARPNTASPTLKVIKINIILIEFTCWDKILTMKILLKESISKINRIVIKWFLLLVIE